MKRSMTAFKAAILKRMPGTRQKDFPLAYKLNRSFDNRSKKKIPQKKKMRSWDL